MMQFALEVAFVSMFFVLAGVLIFVHIYRWSR